MAFISDLQLGSSTANSGSWTSITVPANAKLAVLCLDAWCNTAGVFSDPTSGANGSAPTLGGTSMTNADTSNVADTTAYHQGGMYYLIDPPTGSSKTLAFDWQGTAAFDQTAVYLLAFYDNVVTGVRARGGQQTETGGGTTGSLGSNSGDLLIAIGAYWGPPTSVTWSGNVTQDGVYEDSPSSIRVASGTASGNETITTTVGSFDGAIFAVAMIPGAGGPTIPVFSNFYRMLRNA